MIQVYDDVFAEPTHRRIYSAVLNSFFKINGWSDRTWAVTQPLPCIHSNWSQADATGCGLLEGLSNVPSIDHFILGRSPAEIIVNLSHPGDVYQHHVHTGKDVVLLYINDEWRREWAWETLFYDPHSTHVEKTVEMRPNRVVTFDGETPHTIRPSTYLAPKYRLTLSLTYSKM